VEIPQGRYKNLWNIHGMVDNGKEIPEDRSEIVKEFPWDGLEVTKSCGNSTEAKNSLKICGNSKGGGGPKNGDVLNRGRGVGLKMQCAI
jgi:hypothetical protein